MNENQLIKWCDSRNKVAKFLFTEIIPQLDQKAPYAVTVNFLDYLFYFYKTLNVNTLMQKVYIRDYPLFYKHEILIKYKKFCVGYLTLSPADVPVHGNIHAIYQINEKTHFCFKICCMPPEEDGENCFCYIIPHFATEDNQFVSDFYRENTSYLIELKTVSVLGF